MDSKGSTASADATTWTTNNIKSIKAVFGLIRCMNKLTLTLFIIGLSLSSYSQVDANLYSAKNRILYAEHLLKNKNYNKAFEEYNAIWDETRQSAYALKAAKCLRLQDSFFKNTEFISSTGPLAALKYEHAVMKLITKHIPHSPFVRPANSFNSDTTAALTLAEYLLEEKVNTATKYFTVYKSSFIPQEEWKPVVEFAIKYKAKKPWVAAGLSALVPGLGKIYAGRTIDGLVGFVSVASFGMLAYEGFTYKRFRSVSAWIYAPLAAGFYIGNIYGGAKAAKSINHQKLRLIHAETQKVLLSHID